MNDGPSHPAVCLRLLDPTDQGLYQQLYGDAATMRHVGPPLDDEQVRRSFLAACRLNLDATPTARFWVIEDGRTGFAFGLIGLHWDGPASAELGVVLPPEHQGKGLATGAIRCLLEPAFDGLGIKRLHTRHEAGHQLAGGLMASVGFVALPARSGADGQCWELTAGQWRASRA